MFDNPSGTKLVIVIIVIIIVLGVVFWLLSTKLGQRATASVVTGNNAALTGVEGAGSQLWSGAQNVSGQVATGLGNIGGQVWTGAGNVGSQAWTGAKELGTSVGQAFNRSTGQLVNTNNPAMSGTAQSVTGNAPTPNANRVPSGATTSVPVSDQMNKGPVPFTLYNFYSPRCMYSVEFMPVWNSVAKNLSGISSLSVRAVDATLPKNEDLAFYYNISAYPTIILVTPNRNIEYSGNRAVEDLQQFVVKHINEYM